MSSQTPLASHATADTDSILHLVAELEHRLTGSSVSSRLSPTRSAAIDDASTYVFVLFDGLGSAQLSHPAARSMAAAERGPIQSMFPTTTTVNLSTVATGLPPITHGVIGHHMWVPELENVINVLKWMIPGGNPVDFPTTNFLPSENLWERLKAAGIEPITVQPGAFERSHLSRMLYRGCRIEPVWNEGEIVSATTDLAKMPGRLIFTYLPHVDIAAHLHGQNSREYADAVALAGRVWDTICNSLPEHAVAVGTADHGHIDYSSINKVPMRRRPDCLFFGDPRALYARSSDPELGLSLADEYPATWHGVDELLTWLGDGPLHPQLMERLPTGVLLADEGHLLIPNNMDRRLTGYHGGRHPDEQLIPMLVS